MTGRPGRSVVRVPGRDGGYGGDVKGSRGADARARVGRVLRNPWFKAIATLVVLVFVVGGGFLLTYANNAFYNVAGGVSLLFSLIILLLELFIGALQAYIFTVLTAQYVSSSIAEAH